MRTLFFSLAFTVGLLPAAFAGSPTLAKQVTAPQARSYWLSDGLNRLVFWQPQTAASAKPRELPDAR